MTKQDIDLDKFYNLLSKYIQRVSKFDNKKSQLVLYWLNDYIRYLKQEETYKPNYQPIYKQGSIVFADLGFNIGNEYGGLHYAIVLNKHDSKRNPVLTVLPLSSIKPNKTQFKNTELNLEDEIYQLLSNKIDTVLLNLQKLIKEFKQISYTDEKITQLITQLKSQEEYALTCYDRLKKIKEGSFAILNQITTISKMRIKDPITKQSPMYEVIITNTSMSKVFNKIKELYLNWQNITCRL